MTTADQTPQEIAGALRRALAQSIGVKAKAEAVAEDLGLTNAIVERRIAEGESTVSAHEALAAGAHAESRVQECADDLDEVNGGLATGIDNLRVINAELAAARRVLARTHVALATAREEERTARMQSLHDAATGVPNRELFDDRLAHAMSIAKRHAWTLAVMFIDLDRFKQVNDEHGHAAGDIVLKAVAARLLAHCRHEDTVCRNGGDEFLYLLINPRATSDAARIASEVAKSIARPIDADGVGLVVTPSIGIAMFPADATQADQLVRHVDAAMYRAKRARKSHAFFGADETQ